MEEQTKEDYTEKGFGGRVGYGHRPAIIVVDFIVGFTDLTSPLASNLEGPLKETVRILEAARARKIPVIFTTVEYDPSLLDAGLFPRKVAGLKWLITGSRWVELDPRLNRQPGEIIIRKKGASSFFGTHLSTTLNINGIDTLIVTGCTTSGCVRATVVDALQYGFHAIIPFAAVGDRARLPHEANLFDMNAKYGDVVAMEEVLDYINISPSILLPPNQ